MDVTKKNILSTLKKMKKHERSATYFKKIFTQASKEGLNINDRYEQGKNILHYTIEGGYDNLINFFIKLGLNPDICDDNFVSPLHLAVNKNNKKAVKKLLKAGSDVDCAGEFEQTPLHLATISGDLKMIKLLLKYHADIKLVDEKNLSVIDYAIDEKNVKIINYLKKQIYKKEEKI